MEFLLSTVADLNCVEDGEGVIITDLDRTGPVAAKYGLGIEIADFCTPENLDKDFSEADIRVKKKLLALRAANVRQVTFHSPYNELYPCAIDPMIRKVAYLRYEQALSLAASYGAKKIVIHAGWLENVYFKSFFIKESVGFWIDFLDRHPGDYIICLENVTETAPDFLTEIIRQVNDDRLRICLDIGHANITGTSPEEWLEKCAPYISHLHVHNNKGVINTENKASNDLHLPPGEGVMDVETLLLKAKKLCGQDLTAAIEAWKVEEAAIWLKEHDFI